jgi:hypothetical protein
MLEKWEKEKGSPFASKYAGFKENSRRNEH